MSSPSRSTDGNKLNAIGMADVWDVDDRGIESQKDLSENNTDYGADLSDFDANWESIIDIHEMSATEKNEAAKADAEEKQRKEEEEAILKKEAELKKKRDAELAARQRKREAKEKKFQSATRRRDYDDDDEYYDDAYDKYSKYDTYYDY